MASLTLTNALYSHYYSRNPELVLSQELMNCLIEKVEPLWNHEVILYKASHPVQSSLCQKEELPVHEALSQAPRLMAIGLRGIQTDAEQLWSKLGLPGAISSNVNQDDIHEED